MRLAQRHSAVTSVRLEPAAHGLESSTLPLRSLEVCCNILQYMASGLHLTSEAISYRLKTVNSVWQGGRTIKLTVCTLRACVPIKMNKVSIIQHTLFQFVCNSPALPLHVTFTPRYHLIFELTLTKRFPVKFQPPWKTKLSQFMKFWYLSHMHEVILYTCMHCYQVGLEGEFWH